MRCVAFIRQKLAYIRVPRETVMNVKTCILKLRGIL